MSFKIGMKLDAILQQVKDNKNIDEKFKNCIFNFCNSDKDEVITNENELQMLNCWANNKDVTLPKPLQDKFLEEWTDEDGDVYREYEADNGGRMLYIKHKDGTQSCSWSKNSFEEHFKKGEQIDDSLHADSNGVVGFRIITESNRDENKKWHVNGGYKNGEFNDRGPNNGAIDGIPDKE